MKINCDSNHHGARDSRRASFSLYTLSIPFLAVKPAAIAASLSVLAVAPAATCAVPAGFTSATTSLPNGIVSHPSTHSKRFCFTITMDVVQLQVIKTIGTHTAA
eukprot:IDg4838t1